MTVADGVRLAFGAWLCTAALGLGMLFVLVGVRLIVGQIYAARQRSVRPVR